MKLNTIQRKKARGLFERAFVTMKLTEGTLVLKQLAMRGNIAVPPVSLSSRTGGAPK